MDALKAEIASKRKNLHDDPAVASRPTKYMRRGDIERLKEEQERKIREEKGRSDREQEESLAQATAAKKAAHLKVRVYLSSLCLSQKSHPWMEDRLIRDHPLNRLSLGLLEN